MIRQRGVLTGLLALAAALMLATTAMAATTPAKEAAAKPAPAKKAPAKELPPYVIPVATDSTGPFSSDQIIIFLGQQMAIAAINAQGGIAGRKLAVRAYDTGSDNAKAVPVYNAMVNDVHPTVILSNFSGPAAAMLPSLNRDKVNLINVSGAAPLLEPPGYAFCARPDYPDELIAFANWLKTSLPAGKPMPKIALLLVNAAFGQASTRAVPVLESMGFQVVTQQFVPFSLVDPTPQLLAIRDAKPDYVWVVHALGQMAQIMTAANQLGLTKETTFVAPSVGGLVDVARISGVAATEGMMQVSPYASFTETKLPGVKAMNQMLQQDNPAQFPPGINHYMGWSTAALAAEALRIAVAKVGWDKLTGEDVHKALTSGKLDIGGVTFPQDFSKTRRGTNFERVHKVVKGVPTPQSDWYPLPYNLKY